jgi:uncharacterized membrane protein (UPF0127 family)
MVFRRVFLAGVLGAMAALCACAPTKSNSADAAAHQELVISTSSGDHRFKIELADTDNERRIGLMYRTSLPEDAGMLFDFGPGENIQSMWMKNTLIPLDMAFVAGDGRIVRIEANTTPRSLASISSGEPVLAVLEVNGGRFEALGVRPGDVVRHPLFRRR